MNDLIQELAKQLPVKDIYHDAGSPAVKEAGSIAEDLMKALHLALAPVQYVAAVQDRFRAFLRTSVARVPEARRIAPPPQILGPVLEGVRYEPEGTPIDELFSQLMSRSMDREHVNEAHPAYPILIKQLSSDEAKILAMLNGAQFDFVWTRSFNAETRLFYGHKTVEVDDLPRNGLVFPDNIQFYMEHLHQLGLAGIYQQGNQEPIYLSEITKIQIGIRVRNKYALTDFGQRFVKACLPGLN